MRGATDLLLGVWREACQHIEIGESTTAITRLVAPHLPLERLLVVGVDREPLGLTLLAATGGGESTPSIRTRVPLSPSAGKRLMAWAGRSELMAIAEGSPKGRGAGFEASLAPLIGSGATLLGPLIRDGSLAGLLIHSAPPQVRLSASQSDIFMSLCAPFSAALENDRRLHELAALHHAAEADRRSLLSRIGREEMQAPIVGAESGLRQVMERVRLVAAADLPVLILGETGTGKEVVSRAIHVRSPRAAQPFIRVNCGAIPADLIDSQLFGHEKGSFTGAFDSRQGWFERADGGTLFLDEIGELPLPAQVRLLRVLQDGFIERVGGQRPIRVDVRIVAATHRDLSTMVHAGTFREDLWYRVNVFPILLPRLAERPEDIPDLARHFAERAARRFGLPCVAPTPQDLQLLLQYPWPGNIRELGAVIDRAAILGEGLQLDIAKALGRPPASSGGSRENTEGARSHERHAPGRQPSGDAAEPHGVVTLDMAIKHHIQRALIATHGRVEGKQGAAKLLGINPHTLRSRMRKLGIVWSHFR